MEKINKMATIPTIQFSSWLQLIRNAQITGEGIDVPCGECSGCCTSSYFVHIKPDETRTLAMIPKNLLFPAPGLSRGNMALGYDEKGHCPMFIDNRCSIYDCRPQTCRNYDCRVFAATGLPAGDGKELISQQVHRWKFEFPTTLDHNRFIAVQTAAMFLTGYAKSFPNGFVPSNTTQQAILAIIVYEVFLNFVDEAENRDRINMNQEILEAIMVAYDIFKTGKYAY